MYLPHGKQEYEEKLLQYYKEHIMEVKEIKDDISSQKRTLIPAEAISKFRELTAARMSAIGQQLFQMKKIPGKRGIDYSREDVEKNLHQKNKEATTL